LQIASRRQQLKIEKDGEPQIDFNNNYTNNKSADLNRGKSGPKFNADFLSNNASVIKFS